MRVAIDIDGTITECPAFFRLLTQSQLFEIVILTGRPSIERESTEELLQELQISYSSLHFVTPKEIDQDSKAKFCKEYRIDVLIDDDDEYSLNLDADTFLLKPRSKTNWESSSKTWKNVKRYESD